MPNRAERIDGYHPVVSKVPAERFDPGIVQVLPEHHALLIWLSFVVNDVPSLIDDFLAVRREQLFTSIAKVEVQLAVRSKLKSVDAVIMVLAADARVHDFFAIRFVVTVVVVEVEDFSIRGHDHSIS